jgi:large subunit ribosomal protein L23
MNAYEVIFYPLMTESASLMVEKDNKLVFIVNLKATKRDVKKAVEELYEVKVADVNVQLQPEYKAADVAIKLGIL